MNPRNAFSTSAGVASQFAFVAGLAILCTALAVWMLRPGLIFARGPTTIAVMPIADEEQRSVVAQMAAEIGGRLTDGLAKIENIRVLAPETAAPKADFVVKGELQKSEQAWTIRARMTRRGHRRGQLATSFGQPRGYGPADAAVPARRGRWLYVGAGLNELLNCGAPTRPEEQGRDRTGHRPDQPDIEGTLWGCADNAGKALAEDPDNVEVQVALAALQMRGVQMVWFTPANGDGGKEGRICFGATVRAKPIIFRCMRPTAASFRNQPVQR